MDRPIKDHTKNIDLIIDINEITITRDNINKSFLIKYDKDIPNILKINNINLYIEDAIKTDLRSFSDIKNSLDQEHYDRLDLSVVKLIGIELLDDNKFIRFIYTFLDTGVYERKMVGSTGKLVYSVLTEDYTICPIIPKICW